MRRTFVTLGVVGFLAACGFPGVTYESASDGGGDASGHADSSVGAEGSSDDASEAGDVTAAGDGEASTGVDATGDGNDAGASADSGADGPAADGDASAAVDSSTVDSSAVDSGAVDSGTADSGTVDSSTADSSADVVEDQLVDSAADALDCDQDHDGYRSTAAGCNGNDCCDTDPGAHPGVTAYFSTPDACGSFDYNCNGKNDLEYPVNVTCTGNSITGCSTTDGFTGDTTCGETGTYQSACVLNGLLKCAASDDPTPPTQACN